MCEFSSKILLFFGIVKYFFISSSIHIQMTMLYSLCCIYNYSDLNLF